MTGPEIRHSDRWGECVDRPDADLVELRWFDTTAAMTTQDFNRFIARFADVTEACRRRFALVDAVQFRMDLQKIDSEWRDANIIPRYDAAGIKRFAFHFFEGMPAIGKPPVKVGPASFPTACFATRAAALDWLANS